MPKESRDFRDQTAAAEKKSANDTVEILRTRAKAFKALSSNEEWLSGEMDRITGARAMRQHALDEK
jgi:hypothetical protein